MKKITYIVFLAIAISRCTNHNHEEDESSSKNGRTNFKIVKIDFESDSAEYYYNTSIVLRKEGQTRMAIKYSLKAEQLDKINPLPTMHLGLIHWNNKDLDSAEYYYTKVINKNNKYSPAYSNLGLVLIEKGENKRAINFLKAGIEFSKSDKEAVSCNFNIAVAYVNLNDCEMASKYFVKVRELMGDKDELTVQLEEYINNNCH